MFSLATPEHTGFQGRRAPVSAVPNDEMEPEADMDNFSAGQSRDAHGEAGMLLNIADPFDRLHADDNLGDEAPFPSTWQLLDSADAPND